MWLFRVRVIKSRYIVQFPAERQREPCVAPSAGHSEAATGGKGVRACFSCALEKKERFMGAAHAGVRLLAWCGQQPYFIVRRGGPLGAGTRGKLRFPPGPSTNDRKDGAVSP